MPRLAIYLLTLVTTSAVAAQPGTSGRRASQQGAGDVLFQAFDTDRDGNLSRAELARAQEIFNGIDRNGDGALTPNEFSQAGARHDGGRVEPDPAGHGLPGGGPGRGGRPGRGGGRRGPGPIAELPKMAPMGLDDTEAQALDLLRTLHTDPRDDLNVGPGNGRLLRLLAEHRGAQHVVEIGTNDGYTALWMSLGLRATGGQLTIFEVDSARVARAKSNLDKAGVGAAVKIVQGPAEKQPADPKNPIDILVLHADRKGYLDTMNELYPRVRPGGLIAVHVARQPDAELVATIADNGRLEPLFLERGGVMMAVILKKRPLVR